MGGFAVGGADMGGGLRGVSTQGKTLQPVRSATTVSEFKRILKAHLTTERTGCKNCLSDFTLRCYCQKSNSDGNSTRSSTSS